MADRVDCPPTSDKSGAEAGSRRSKDARRVTGRLCGKYAHDKNVNYRYS